MSRVQTANGSSARSPAASCRQVVTQSASDAISAQPFNSRNTSATTRLVRSLPSTKGQSREMPKA